MKAAARDSLTSDDIASLIANYGFESLSEFHITESEWDKTSRSMPLSHSVTDNTLVQRIVLLQDFDKVAHRHLVSEETRLATFDRDDSNVNQVWLLATLKDTNLPLGNTPWPRDGSKPWPHTLASAGFFATLDADRVYCFCCNLSMSDLEGICEPWIMHAVRSPDCAYTKLMKGVQFVAGRYSPLHGSESCYHLLFTRWLLFAIQLQSRSARHSSTSGNETDESHICGLTNRRQSTAIRNRATAESYWKADISNGDN